MAEPRQILRYSLVIVPLLIGATLVGVGLDRFHKGEWHPTLLGWSVLSAPLFFGLWRIRHLGVGSRGMVALGSVAFLVGVLIPEIAPFARRYRTPFERAHGYPERLTFLALKKDQSGKKTLVVSTHPSTTLFTVDVEHEIAPTGFGLLEGISQEHPLVVAKGDRQDCLGPDGKVYFNWRYKRVIRCLAENGPVIVQQPDGKFELTRMDGSPIRVLPYLDIKPTSSDSKLALAQQAGGAWILIGLHNGQEATSVPVLPNSSNRADERARQLLSPDWITHSCGRMLFVENGKLGVTEYRSILLEALYDDLRIYPTYRPVSEGGGRYIRKASSQERSVWSAKRAALAMALDNPENGCPDTAIVAKDGLSGIYDLDKRRWVIEPILPQNLAFGIPVERDVEGRYLFQGEEIRPGDKFSREVDGNVWKIVKR
jgi:hypothetical protein